MSDALKNVICYDKAELKNIIQNVLPRADERVVDFVYKRLEDNIDKDTGMYCMTPKFLMKNVIELSDDFSVDRVADKSADVPAEVPAEKSLNIASASVPTTYSPFALNK